MKKILFIGLVISGLLFSCGDKCDDVNCANGGVCADGTCVCPDGYEGENCDIQGNEKFTGDYDTDYTGTGAFASTTGNTTAFVTEGDKANKIQIDVELDLTADVLGQTIDLPLVVSVQADIEDNTYHIPQTEISANAGGLPIQIIFEVEGTLDGNNLNSLLTMSGTLTGTVDMEGTK